MNIRQKIETINRIADEFQEKYDLTDVTILLKNYKIKDSGGWSDFVDTREYLKYALSNASDSVIISIASDFNIPVPSMVALTSSLPKEWRDDNLFRLFISHLAIHKKQAKRLKDTLSPYHISGFIAHEDIEPTKEWQKEIERALWTMDAMLAVHTEKFSESIWTQQEIGFALGRGLKVISLKMDEDPRGFISKNQAILRSGRTAESVSTDIVSIITNDLLTKERMAQIAAKHKVKETDADEIPF
jgi:hypothetical protein